MKAKRKDELRNMSVEKLKSLRSELKLPLIKAKLRLGGVGFNAPMNTPTKLVNDLNKEIAILNTFINQK